jgi:hypothetical protein
MLTGAPGSGRAAPQEPLTSCTTEIRAGLARSSPTAVQSPGTGQEIAVIIGVTLPGIRVIVPQVPFLSVMANRPPDANSPIAVHSPPGAQDTAPIVATAVWFRRGTARAVPQVPAPLPARAAAGTLVRGGKLTAAPLQPARHPAAASRAIHGTLPPQEAHGTVTTYGTVTPCSTTGPLTGLSSVAWETPGGVMVSITSGTVPGLSAQI